VLNLTIVHFTLKNLKCWREILDGFFGLEVLFHADGNGNYLSRLSRRENSPMGLVRMFSLGGCYGPSELEFRQRKRTHELYEGKTTLQLRLVAQLLTNVGPDISHF